MTTLGNTIDLYTVRFWVPFFAAVLAIGPISAATLRKWAFALLNLGFIALYLGPVVAFVDLFSALVAVCLLLRFVADGRIGGWVAGLSGTVVLGLFVLNKLPWLGSGMGLAGINPVLATIGFSYIALRLFDMGRAVLEGRQPPPDLVSTINYLVPFHMLAAGPIQAYDEFVAQPAVPDALGPGAVLEALERIAAGLFKKFILANMISKLFLTDFRAGGPYVLIEMQMNFLWLYLDFSAYSDVAVGVGRLMGVATPENFDRPYLARNVIEFWERWHISLSLFIRRNVFIPVQVWLMRRTDGRAPLLVASVAFAISFLLCGLWHRVNVHWFAWGALQAAGLIACNLYKYVLTKRLGRKGVNQYLANPWFRALAIAVTFEFEAFTVLVATYPIEELYRWIGYR